MGHSRIPDLLTYALRAAAAALAGALMQLAFSTNHAFWPLVFVALVPLEWAIRRVRPLEVYCWAFVTFYVFLIGSNWWLHKWGWGAADALTFMEASAYAIGIAIASWLRTRLGRDPWHLLLPVCIVLVEFKRGAGFWAFPWPLLGHALVFAPVLLQSAALWGAGGLSFLVAWSNAVIGSACFDEIRPPQQRWAQAVPFLAIFLFAGVYGLLSL
ncbi:MAG: hypothetical protein ABI743_04475, partial [bacterium]